MSEITWYGHSAFKISTADVSVLIDPFFSPASQMSVEKLGHVDMVLVTHDHGDHVGESVAICRKYGSMLGAIVGTADKLASQGIPGKQILNGIGFNMGGSVTHRGIAVTMTQAFHSSDSGAPAGYIVTMPDGLTVYHAGDTCLFDSMRLWAQLHPVDVALLPVGGVFTMDAKQAALACELLQCKTVIPMHWGTFPMLAQSTEEFEAALARACPACRCIAMRPGQCVSCAPESV